jgi:hypothetical protein
MSPHAQPAEVLAATRPGASTSRDRRRVRGGLPMFDRSGHRVDVTPKGVIQQHPEARGERFRDLLLSGRTIPMATMSCGPAGAGGPCDRFA